MAENIQVLTFEGSQTIEKAQSVKESLLQALKSKKEKILINLSKVEKVDLSFLQLLHAAGLEAEKKGKELSLSGDIPDDFISAVKLAGFDRNLYDGGAMLFKQLTGEGA
ncbi:STAS domain-containing protein [Spirochaeta isovalerica]|uniref:Anti-anti-sigma regulatory factor n=1 Tax=Spirochaeta isovalerica TaxID=150 RepID=A0A841R1X2_9SPIO|nr:STAS domain-containing protein [Spirochaeta isovalerica]MBB6479014.1 anti-anti-sigma regulatory factor [Spirochaeta isovalerica]